MNLSLRETPKKRGFARDFLRQWQLYAFFLLPLLYLLVFCYYPMLGLQIAFKNYSAVLGIWNSEWTGLKHFITFFPLVPIRARGGKHHSHFPVFSVREFPTGHIVRLVFERHPQ